MGVFNFYGLIAVVTILVPNLMWAMGKKGEFTEYYNNKLVSVLEQIGRFGCFITMIVNIPYTYFGYFFEYGNLVYFFFGYRCLRLSYRMDRKRRKRGRRLCFMAVYCAVGAVFG